MPRTPETLRQFVNLAIEFGIVFFNFKMDFPKAKEATWLFEMLDVEFSLVSLMVNFNWEWH